MGLTKVEKFTSESITDTSGGNVGIGTTPNVLLDVLSGTANTAADTITDQTLTVTGANIAMGGALVNTGIINIASNDAQAVDIGGSISFSGRFTTSATTQAGFAVIKGAKENSTTSNTSSYLAFGTRENGNDITEQMRIDSTGNVSIGTSSPGGHRLLVEDSGASNIGVLAVNVDTSATANSFQWASSMLVSTTMTSTSNVISIIGQAESTKDSGYIGFNFTSTASDSNFLTFGLFGTDNIMNITPADEGRVGIGTKAPSRLLHLVYTADDPDKAIIRVEAAGGSRVAGIEFYSGHGNWAIYNSDTVADTLEFRDDSAAAVRMAIDPTGKVGIGTTTPGEILTVHEGTSNRFTYIFEDHISFTRSSDAAVAGGIDFDGSATVKIRANAGGGTIELSTNSSVGVTVSSAQAVRFNAYGSGTLVTDGSGNITASSDAKLKTFMTPFTKGLKEVLGLEPKSYHWTEESGFDTVNKYTGFIANEVEIHISEAVGTDNKGLKTLSDRPIIGALVNSTQELYNIIQKQDERIKELELKNK